MKVIYDISVLGLGYYHARARTGVFRVVENVAYGLANSRECDLNFCANLSLENLNQSLDYLSSNQKFRDIPFTSPGIEKDIHKILMNLVGKINSKSKIGLPSRISRKILHIFAKFLEFNTQLVDSKLLTETDIYHSPFHPLPEDIKIASNPKRFLTLCDLIPILFPKFFSFNENHIIKIVLESLRSDDWVICISHSTKNDLCNYLKGMDPSRVFVTHLAASELFYPCSDFERVAVIKKKFNIPPDVPYILSLSTLEPRKNIDHTIRCFAKLVSQENITDLYLVLVGKEGWDYGGIFEEISGCLALKDRVIVTGYVADEDLAALYSGALVFVYPSLYEGFGLPPLEAMQCGLPVITSNTSSLPEVVGDAGIMVAPSDADALCQSILEFYNKPSLRESMSLSSIERAKKFSWEKCTQETINAYKTALNS